MPDFDDWLGSTSTGGVAAATKAVQEWRRISAKPTSVTLMRGAANIAAQTVRIEFRATQPGEPVGGAGTAAVLRATVFGVKDHPTVAATNIRKGDRFLVGDAEYRVIDVAEYPGGVQASAERTR